MSPQDLSLMDKVAFSVLIPATLLPLMFTVAFFRVWKRIKKWQFGLLFVSAAVVLLAQIAQHLATNIPRVGKTEVQVALAKDIPWLSNLSMVLSSIGVWGLLIGLIGSMYLIKHIHASFDE